MTINIANNNPRINYTATANQTVFTVPFEFFDNTDIKVYIEGTLKTITTHYTVSGGNGSTGTVTLTAGATLNDEVTLVRDVPLERTTDLTSSYNAASIDAQLDRIVAEIADLDDRVSRTIQINDYELASGLLLPALDSRKGKTIQFNTSSGALEVGPTGADLTAIGSVTSEIATLAGISGNITTVAGSNAAITAVSNSMTSVNAINTALTNVNRVGNAIVIVDLVGTSISDVNDVADSLGEISAVQAKLTNIDTVAIASTNIGTVAGSISQVNSVASKIADVTGVNNNISAITTANANSTNINLVANNIDDVNDVGTVITKVTTVADNIASVNTVAPKVSEISTVSANIGNVNTVATNISTINSAAGSAADALASKNAAATSATNAANSATASANSATAAAASASSITGAETNAANSATSAATSATAAQTAKTAAETALDEFTDIYLGSKSVAPTVDNDGNALATGSIYWNTGVDQLYIWTGSAWDDAAFTASGAVTSFNTRTGAVTLSSADVTNAAGLLTTGGTMTGALNVESTITSDGLTVDGHTTLNTSSTLFANLNYSGSNLGKFSTDGVNVNVEANSNLLLKANGATRAKFDGNGDISFYEDTGTTAKFFWDSSAESLGIGTNNPNSYSGQTTLTINGQSYGRLDVESADTLRASLFATAGSTTLSATTDILSFDTSGGEAMRIDLSGNVLTGKSSQTIDTVGVELLGSLGKIHATRDGGASAGFNRKTSDGDIAVFYKDGSAVGSIGSRGTGTSYITLKSTSGAGAGLTGSDNRILPMDESALADANTDLGMSTYRWKDLYLSGTVNASVFTSSATVADVTVRSKGSFGNLILDTENSNGLIQFKQAGSEKMRIDSSGRVGIGTTAPAQLLEVSGNLGKSRFTRSGSSGTTMEFYAGGTQAGGIQVQGTGLGISGAARENDLFIDSSGNVMVGTTTYNGPANATTGDYGAALWNSGLIAAGTNASEVLVLNRMNSDGDIAVFKRSGSPVGSIGANGGRPYFASGGCGVKLGGSDFTPVTSAGAGTDNVVNLGSSTARFKDLYLSGGVSLDGSSGNTLYKSGSDLVLNNRANATMIFGTNNTERLRIDSSGNVGIGTSSPQAELHVHDPVGHAKIRLSGAASDADTFEIYQGITGVTNGGLTIRDVEASADRLVINSSGNVGIGTNSPASDGKLTIHGTDTDSGILLSRASGNDVAVHNIGGTLAFRTGGESTTLGGLTERMRIDSDGIIILNRTGAISNTFSLNMQAKSSGGIIMQPASNASFEAMRFVNFGLTAAIGNITCSTTSTAYNTSSDYRLKENVVDLTGASARVNQLNPSRFNFISDDTNTTVDGFLAHEVADVVPEAITGTKDAMKDEEYEVTPAVLDEDGNVTTEAVMGTRSVPDYQGIDQSKLVPLLTAALQEALTEIASLKTRVEALEG